MLHSKNANFVLKNCSGVLNMLRKWKFCAQEMEVPCSENGKFPQCHGKPTFLWFSKPNRAILCNSVLLRSSQNSALNSMIEGSWSDWLHPYRTCQQRPPVLREQIILVEGKRYQKNLLHFFCQTWWLISHCTVEPFLKDCLTGHKKAVSQKTFSLVTGKRKITLKCRTFCQEYLVFQDGWSLMAVVSQDRFHCITYSLPLVSR